MKKVKRKKWRDKKKVLKWRVWKKEAVVSLRSCILSELEFDIFFFLL